MATPPSPDRRSAAQRVSQFARRSTVGLTHQELRAVLNQAAYGYVQDLADIFEGMLGDHQVRAVYETRLTGVASAVLKVLPAPGEDPVLAEEVAAFAREQFAASDDFARTTQHGMNAVGYGWSLLEHEWQNHGGVWKSVRQVPVHHRDTRFAGAWELEARGRDQSWIKTSLEPTRWIRYTPSTLGLIPPMAGCLYAAMWPWLFRRWHTVYQQIGLERFANPLLVGVVKERSSVEAREVMRDALVELRGDQAGVIEGDDDIRILEPSKSPGDTWQGAIAQRDAEIAKAILGSTLNTEVALGGGNRATAVSQGAISIHPRLVTDAASWAQRGLVDQWLRPALRFNAAQFGYRAVKMPLVLLQLTAEAGPQVDDLMLRSGAVTKDEVRESRGWPRWGPEKGGNDIATDQVVEKQTEAWVRSAGEGDSKAEDAASAPTT